MKNYILLFFKFSFFIAFISAQTNKINYVQIEDVKIGNQIGVGNSVNDLKSIFGTPNLITEQFDSIIDQVLIKYYYYQNTYFEIKKGFISSFKLANERFTLFGLKEGDTEIKFLEKFPQSYSKKYFAGESGKQLMTRVGIITTDGIKSDASYLVFCFSNNKISSIEYWINP